MVAAAVQVVAAVVVVIAFQPKPALVADAAVVHASYMDLLCDHFCYLH